MGLQLQHRAAKCFFVKLGDFSTEGDNPLAGTEIVKLVKQFGHAVRALVEDDRAWHLEEGSQALLAAFFVWQKPFEVKAVAGQS